MAAEVMTVLEAADYLRVSRRTMYRLIESGAIPSAKGHGVRRRFMRGDLDSYLDDLMSQPRLTRTQAKRAVGRPRKG